MPVFTLPPSPIGGLTAGAEAHFQWLVTSPRVAASGVATSTANPFFWYVTRAAAISSYMVLTVVVLLGISRSLVRISGSHASWALDEIHQFLALLVAALVGLHLLSLFLDPLIPFSLLNFWSPVSEPYRPFTVDLGVFAFYGLVIVLLSSWLRRYIKHTTWRTLHYTSFAVFALVTGTGAVYHTSFTAFQTVTHSYQISSTPTHGREKRRPLVSFPQVMHTTE